MPLFENNDEKQRKANLKVLEDKRVIFAEKLEKMGFAPERMLLCSGNKGNFTALARHNGKLAIVESPVLGTDDDFSIEILDEINFSREEVYEKGTGLNGAFGFGTKGAKGFILTFTMSGGRLVTMDVVAGRSSWGEMNLKKNALIKTKRRRGDANVIWDLMPLDPNSLPKVEAALNEYYLV